MGCGSNLNLEIEVVVVVVGLRGGARNSAKKG
jgi:hypothetical protein